jgi:hypothetical protein
LCSHTGNLCRNLEATNRLLMIVEAPLDVLARKKCLQSFVECLDQWKGESDQSCIPSYIQVLISTPVRDLTSQNFPPKVLASTSILEILQIFQSARTVIVSIKAEDNAGADGHPSEIVLSRLTFLQHAVTSPSMSAPLSSIINSIATPGLVGNRETLDIVLQSMLGAGFEEVGITEGGSVTSVLHVDEIFSFLSKELAWTLPEADTSQVDETSMLSASRCTPPSHGRCCTFASHFATESRSLCRARLCRPHRCAYPESTGCTWEIGTRIGKTLGQ